MEMSIQLKMKQVSDYETIASFIFNAGCSLSYLTLISALHISNVCFIESKPPRTFKEWIIAFLENDEEDNARQNAQLYKQRDDEDDELLAAGGRTDTERQSEDDSYYEEIDFEIDESVLEGLIIAGLVAALLILIYVRQQRNRQRENEVAAAGGPVPGVQAGANQRGFFPRPDQPEFAQWVAGGVGH
jgi:SEL1 protein